MAFGSPISRHQPVEPAVTTTNTGSKDADSCTWTHSLCDKIPAKKAPVVAAIISAYVAALCLLHNPLIALVPAALVVSAVSEYLFAIRYCISKSGVTARWGWNMLEMSWSDIKRIYLLPDCIKFSPLDRSGSRFEEMRGILVRFASEEERDRILNTVRLYREVFPPNV